MPIDVAKLLITVGSDITGAEKGLKSATDKLNGFADSAQKIGGVMTVGVTAPLMALGTQAVFAASDLEESMNKVSVVFGTSAQQVTSFARTASSTLGMSEQAALEATGTFGNLFTTIGLGVDDAADMSTSIVQLASDLASFNNIDPTVALEKLRSGLVGEVEPLRTLGVNLTESTVQLKAMEMGLAATADQLTQQDKLMARYALIMEQTGTAQGDFARTSDGLANQMRTLRASFTDASSALGSVLLPYVNDAVGVAIQYIQKFQGLDESTQKWIVTIGGLAAAMGPLALGIGTVIKAVNGLSLAMATIGGPFTLIIAGVAAIATAIYLLVEEYKKMEEATASSNRTAQESMDVLMALSGEAGGVAVAAHDVAWGFDTMGNRIDYATQQQIDAIFTAQELARSEEDLARAAEDAAMALVQAGLSGELASATETYTETIARLKEEYTGLEDAARGWAPSSTKVKDLTEQMNANKQAQQDAAAALREATTQMIFQQAAAGLDAAATLELARAMGVLSEQDYAVAQTVQNLKTNFEGLDGVMSASEAQAYAGQVENLNQAVQNLTLAGLPVTVENINSEMEQLTALEFPEFDTEVWGNLHNEVETTVGNMSTTATEGFDSISADATATAIEVKNAFTNENWTLVGSNVSKGMADGIKSGIPSIEAAARTAAQRALAAAMNELGVESPSRKFAWIGEQTMAGLALGIRDNALLPAREAAYAASATTVGATYHSTYSPQVSVQATVANDIDMYRLASEIAGEIRRGRL